MLNQALSKIENISYITDIRFLLKAHLLSYWTFVIIVSDLLHIQVAFSMLSNRNTNLESAQIYLGLATLMSYFSLNSYLMHHTSISYIPNTIIRSTGSVLAGFLGILPVAIGVGVICMVYLGSYFRFKDISNSLMVMFYISLGDTVFDVYYGSGQVNFLFNIVFSYIWMYFAGSVILNITLAQVEEGYLEQKYSTRFEWLSRKNISDPQQAKEIGQIKEGLLTLPEALKKLKNND